MSFDWEDTRELVNDDEYDLMLKRIHMQYGVDSGERNEYNSQLQTNINVCAKEFLSSRTSTNTDLFFFWEAFYLLSQLDDEDSAVPIVTSLGSQFHSLGRSVKESIWTKKGIIHVFNSCLAENRGNFGIPGIRSRREVWKDACIYPGEERTSDKEDVGSIQRIYRS